MDELTSALMDSSPAPETGGGQTSQTAPQSPEQSSGQSAQPQQAAPRNLYDDPNVRALMSARDQAHGRQVATLQQQIAELQNQYEQVALKDMDDMEKAQWQAQKAQQEAQRYRTILEQQQQAAQLETQKRQDLERLSSMTGVAVDKIQDAATYDEAVERAIKLMRGDAERKKEANYPDIGGGFASTPATRSEAAARDAWKRKDAAAAVRAVLFD